MTTKMYDPSYIGKEHMKQFLIRPEIHGVQLHEPTN